MSIEELIKPRFRIIYDFPNRASFGELGDILDRDWASYPDEDESKPPMWKISDFPHLFQELVWWYHRKEEDMPKYLKHTLADGTTTYHKVDVYDFSDPYWIEWKSNDGRDFGNFGHWTAKFNYMPCTEAEYLANINKKE